MKRNSANLKKYRETCESVFNRAGGRCEVMVDNKGDHTGDVVRRCNHYIPFDEARWINFIHKETRNGKSDEWVLGVNNVVYGCSRHHILEEQTGIRVTAVDNSEEIYLVEPID
jgi:hypothetical protein